MAAAGYPEEVRKGDAIEGLDRAATLPGKVFHAGTREDSGRVVTAEGASFAPSDWDRLSEPRSPKPTGWSTHITGRASNFATMLVTEPSPVSMPGELTGTYANPHVVTLEVVAV